MQIWSKEKLSLKNLLLTSGVVLLQWLLAVTFLFSGFVKLVDPKGMAYKLEAYLTVWHLDWQAVSFLIDVAVIGLSIGEFLLGLYLLLGINRRIATHVVLAVMLFMTALTVYIYLYNPVADCGCFGDALILSHRDTLIKNIILLAAAILLRFQSSRILRIVSEPNQWIFAFYNVVFMVGIAAYSLYYIPLFDFTGFDLGTDVRKGLKGEYRNEYVYQKDGREQSFSEDNLPDSTWTFVTVNTTTVKAPTIKEFTIVGDNDLDLSDSILQHKGYVFLATSSDLSVADKGTSDALNDLYDFALDNGYKFYFLTSSEQKAIAQWREHSGSTYPFAWASTEMLKALVRSNPGLLLMKDGKILNKWSRNNLPSEKEFGTALLKEQKTEKSQQIVKLLMVFVFPIFLFFVLDRFWWGKRLLRIYSYRKTK